jgi:hypothetical protein
LFADSIFAAQSGETFERLGETYTKLKSVLAEIVAEPVRDIKLHTSLEALTGCPQQVALLLGLRLDHADALSESLEFFDVQEFGNKITQFCAEGG